MHPDLDLDLLSLDNFLALSACSISLGTSNLVFGISGCSDGVGDIFSFEKLWTSVSGGSYKRTWKWLIESRKSKVSKLENHGFDVYLKEESILSRYQGITYFGTGLKSWRSIHP